MQKSATFTVLVKLLMDGPGPNMPVLQIASDDAVATNMMIVDPDLLISTAFHVLASGASNLIDYMAHNGKESREELVKIFIDIMDKLSTKDANDLLNIFK